jgi:hypothetical protein
MRDPTEVDKPGIKVEHEPRRSEQVTAIFQIDFTGLCPADT